MGIAESMKGLTEDILASYDVRVKALGGIVADTHKIVKSFASDRKKMSAEQVETLSNFVKDLAKNVGGLLKEFNKNHGKMSEEQEKSLSDFVKNLAKDVSSLLKDFQKARAEMSEELKAKLTKEVKEIETCVKKLLREFDTAHAEMSDALKKSLAKYVGDIVSTVKKLLGEYSSDMAQARNVWQSMSSALAKSRKTGVMSRIEAGEKVATVEEVVTKRKGKKRGRKAKRGKR